MILVLGEILFDVFPDSKMLGGAPFNFAYHLKMLGFDVRFVSRVGRDDLGEEILGFLKTNGFDTADIQQDSNFPTGTVTVSRFPDGGHTFSIAEDTAYDHMVYSDRLKALAKSDWRLFYTGTLIQRNRNNADLVQKILVNKPPGARFFCDVNLRPGCYTPQTIQTNLDQADILKINEEEAVEITRAGAGDVRLEKNIKRLMETYVIDQVILTKGGRGSQWFDGRKTFNSPVPGKIRAVKDTVGAGDAYAAMAAAGLLKGFSPQNIIPVAHEFAGMICRIKGAVPGDTELYRGFIRRLN